MNIKSITDNPYVVLASILFGVLGFFFAIYTYEVTKQFGRLYYIRDSKIIYAALDSGLLREGVIAKKYENEGDLYYTRITIWNGGTLSFEQKDKRTAVLVRGSDQNKIFDFDISSFKSFSENNFELRRVDDRRIEVLWNVFDPRDAVQISIMHSGNYKSISVDGRFAPNYAMGPYVPGNFLLPAYLLGAVLVSVGNYFLYTRFLKKIIPEGPALLREPIMFVLIMLNMFISAVVVMYLIYRFLDYSGAVSPLETFIKGRFALEASRAIE